MSRKKSTPTPPDNPRITVPALLIWGAQDKFLGRELAQPSIDLCDDGCLVFVGELASGHFSEIAGYSVIPSVARSVAEGEVEESCTPNRLRFLDSEDSARSDGSDGHIEKACRSRKCPVARSKKRHIGFSTQKQSESMS